MVALSIISLFFFTFVAGKYSISKVHLNEHGVSATFWGMPWFRASWDEIVEIGSDVIYTEWGLKSANWIYFSKKPCVFKQNPLQNLHNKGLNKNFLRCIPPADRLEEIMALIPKEKFREDIYAEE